MSEHRSYRGFLNEDGTIMLICECGIYMYAESGEELNRSLREDMPRADLKGELFT
jgi:hypothetical protein